MSSSVSAIASVAQMRAVLSELSLPIFVGRFDERHVPLLEVGTLDREAIPAIRTAIGAKLLQSGVRATVKIVAHRPNTLRKARSLETLVSSSGRGALVFDRTKALGRAEAVVEFGRILRTRIGNRVAGLFFDGDRRTMFVLVSGQAADRDEQARLAREIVIAQQEWQAVPALELFDIAVRVGSAVPVGAEVIAVDAKTVRATLLKMLKAPLSTRLGAAIFGTLVGASIAVPSLAGEAASREPAVDAPNLSISSLGGVARDPVLFNHLWAGLTAKATLPLGEQFGAQIDVGIATDSYFGAALHLFARDPAMGLVGLVGSAESKYGVTMNRIGAELEYYLSDAFTVGARAGYQGGTAPNGAFGRVDVKFYPDPNFVITSGVEAQPSFLLARAGFEWRPAIDALAGMSVTADADVTSSGNYKAMFGLHFQLGGSASSLLDRDRKSDPETAIWNEIDVKSAAYAGK